MSAQSYSARYWQVEHALASAFSIPASGLKALRSRLGELQRQGILGVRPGTGTKLDYQPDHFFRLTFALSLLQVGLAPTAIQRVISEHWETQLAGVFQEATQWFGRADAPTTQDDDIVLVFGVRLLTDGMTRAVPTIKSYRLSEVAERAAISLRDCEPWLLFNVTERMRRFFDALAKLHFIKDEPAAP